MKQTIVPFLITALTWMAIGCTHQPKEFSDQKLVIASNETVKIRELDLSITNNGCGRQWESGEEKPYCELVIQRKDATVRAGTNFKPVYIGNIEITIDKMNPWRREEDSVPAGGCRVWVRKVKGR